MMNVKITPSPSQRRALEGDERREGLSHSLVRTDGGCGDSLNGSKQATVRFAELIGELARQRSDGQYGRADTMIVTVTSDSQYESKGPVCLLCCCCLEEKGKGKGWQRRPVD